MYSDIFNAHHLVQKFGNEYAATMYVVKQARRLLNYSNNALTESEAILWIVNERPISELSEYIKRHNEVTKEQKYSLINEFTSIIDDKDIRIRFQESAIKSNKAHKLIIDYGNLNSASCTRLRILLKQYWLDHLKNEVEDIKFR